MRCATCEGNILFIDGEWCHVEDTKCAAVIVDWPEQPIEPDADHEAA